MAKTTLYSVRVRVPSGVDPDELARAIVTAGVAGVEERPGPELVVYAEGALACDSLVNTLLAVAVGFGLTDANLTRHEETSGDWETAWLTELGSVRVSANWSIVPVGAEPARGTRPIWLERTPAFGFGEHATTRLCAAELERLVRARPGARVLDYGSGTGVLALLATLSGAASARGVDLDPRAVHSAVSNAELNGVADRCAFLLADAPPADETFDVVVANIEPRVMLLLVADLSRCVAERGTLVLGGFLDDTAAQVLATLEPEGFCEVRRTVEDEWCQLVLERVR